MSCSIQLFPRVAKNVANHLMLFTTLVQSNSENIKRRQIGSRKKLKSSMRCKSVSGWIWEGSRLWKAEQDMAKIKCNTIKHYITQYNKKQYESQARHGKNKRQCNAIQNNTKQHNTIRKPSKTWQSVGRMSER